MTDVLALDWGKTAQLCEEFIRKEILGRGKDGALLGISGGLDSAVAAALACRALGADQVKGLILPERDSHPASQRDARLVAGYLGVSCEQQSLTGALRRLGVYELVPPRVPVLGSLGWLVPLIPARNKEDFVRERFRRFSEDGNPFVAHLQGARDPTLSASLAFIHAKVRMRALALYLVAEKEDRLLVGTTSRSEWLVGLFVPQGDGAADAMPLRDLYKTQVQALGRYLGLPPEILDKAPSPDLAPGLTDEYALGLSYRTLDLLLYGLEMGWDEGAVLSSAGATPEQLAHTREMVRASEWMRQAPPWPRLRPPDDRATPGPQGQSG